MSFRPLQDRVAVRRVTAAEKSPSGIMIPGIMIPDTAQESRRRARSLDRDELIIIKESDLFGVVVKAAPAKAA